MSRPENDSRRQPSIDIVIPTWNGKTHLANCLRSLAGQTYGRYVVIVVDNGSTDGTLDLIRNHHPGVRLIALPENRGFSAAVNLGIGAGSSPLVFLLNNDTEAASDCLAELVRAAEDHGNGFFAPKMLSYRERDVLDGAGEGYLRGGVGYRLGSMERDSEIYNRQRQVFGACGGAALYRRDMLERIGLFDEDFFAYLEDVDLNVRANRAGYTCLYVPSARVYHIGSATSGSRINPFTVRLSTRNNLFLLVKNYSLIYWLRFLPAIFIYQFFWLLFVVKKRQIGSYLAGVAGFLRGAAWMLKKRKAVLRSPGIGNRELAQRILRAERDAVASIMRRREAQGKGNGLLRLYGKLFL